MPGQASVWLDQHDSRYGVAKPVVLEHGLVFLGDWDRPPGSSTIGLRVLGVFSTLSGNEPRPSRSFS